MTFSVRNRLDEAESVLHTAMDHLEDDEYVEAHGALKETIHWLTQCVTAIERMTPSLTNRPTKRCAVCCVRLYEHERPGTRCSSC